MFWLVVWLIVGNVVAFGYYVNKLNVNRKSLSFFHGAGGMFILIFFMAIPLAILHLLFFEIAGSALKGLKLVCLSIFTEDTLKNSNQPKT